jgi:hypothetical protein
MQSLSGTKSNIFARILCQRLQSHLTQSMSSHQPLTAMDAWCLAISISHWWMRVWVKILELKVSLHVCVYLRTNVSCLSQATMLVMCEWFSQYQRRHVTSSLVQVSLSLNTWSILSGILPSPIHLTAITSCTRFLPFKTKMVDTSVVSSHLWTFSAVFIFFQNLAHLYLRNGPWAMFLTCVVHPFYVNCFTDRHLYWILCWTTILH